MRNARPEEAFQGLSPQFNLNLGKQVRPVFPQDSGPVPAKFEEGLSMREWRTQNRPRAAGGKTTDSQL
jgi:hypothetical protein